MKLFTTVDVVGQGLPLILPKGQKIIQKLQRWVEDIEDREWGYVRTRTPFMAKSDLYKISGHWDHYLDGMFVLGDPEKDGEEEVLAMRPMTCPFQYYCYKNEQHSYRDLPYRMGETSTLFRKEDSGEMHGLTRVRQFTISEGHNVIRPDQTEEELKNCLNLAIHIMETLGLLGDVTFRLSKWDPTNTEKYLGDDEYWETSQEALRKALREKNIDFFEAEGEAAFYGPKIDIQAKNVYGKEDTMITIQLDCAIAENFDMYYVDQNGNKVRPYIIHRTSLGCYERTLAWLIEKYAGLFPTWLCPEQVRVLPISEKYSEYANKVAAELKKRNANRIFLFSTFGLFTNGFEKFDKAYDSGLFTNVLTTNLIYQPPELLEREWYISCDLSKYIAFIIDTLNHDSSISDLLVPNERINSIVARYKAGEDLSANN